MTKIEIDYSKIVVYKLACKDPLVPDVYVGSTTNFIKRKYGHKSATTNYKSKSYDTKIYEFIRNHGGWYNWDMVEIEKYPCKDGNEAHARESYWYDILDCKRMNSNRPIAVVSQKEARRQEYVRVKTIALLNKLGLKW